MQNIYHCTFPMKAVFKQSHCIIFLRHFSLVIIVFCSAGGAAGNDLFDSTHGLL